MKKYISICLVFIATIFLVSCEEENSDLLVGGDGDADLSGRQYANIDPPTNINFLFQGTTAVTIPLGKFEAEGTTINSVEITKVLNIGDLDNDPDTVDPTSSNPVTYVVTGDVFSQSLTELFADVPVDGNVLTENDLSPGDSWTFSYKVNISGNSPTADNVLNINIKTNVPFSCPSDIPSEGVTWTGETQNGAFGVYSTNPNVTIVNNGNGNYSMSDITGGFYEAFGYPPNNPGNINDLCSVITVTGAPDAQFSVGNTGSVPGSYDKVNEVLTVTWYDNLNDIDEATVHTIN